MSVRTPPPLAVDATAARPHRVEFDGLADDYRRQHQANVAITGENVEFFARYKIADLARLVSARRSEPQRLLDFGCGIGNAVPFFRHYFPQCELHCADVSARSIELAQARFPGSEHYLQVGREIPLSSHTMDVVFTACVFHHIPHEEHHYWLAELRRVTRPGGLLAIYEHNPLNPLTVHAVNTCPLDVNARLIRASTMRNRATLAGWRDSRVDFKMFFPSILSGLRPLERYLGWLGLGAQYRITARRGA